MFFRFFTASVNCLFYEQSKGFFSILRFLFKFVCWLLLLSIISIYHVKNDITHISFYIILWHKSFFHYTHSHSFIWSNFFFSTYFLFHKLCLFIFPLVFSMFTIILLILIKMETFNEKNDNSNDYCFSDYSLVSQ